MRSGKLDKFIQVRKDARTKRTDGGYDEVDTLVEEVWAAIRPLQARERFTHGQLQQAISHSVTVRQPSQAERGMRVVLGSRVFHIEAAHDPDEEGVWWRLDCREAQA